jgi:hypothetical protein
MPELRDTFSVTDGHFQLNLYGKFPYRTLEEEWVRVLYPKVAIGFQNLP